MPNLWLTYAWKDNEANAVDLVISELERQGLTVKFDRAHLVAGQRLWPQLDRAISDPQTSDGWAVYATRNSLESEPCQEELAYALDRAIRTRGGGFPLIGIFPEPMDRALVPGALATRLYVNLSDPNWAGQVAHALAGRPHAPARHAGPPFEAHLHRVGNLHLLEARPLVGSWAPFLAYVPEAEQNRLNGVITGLPGRATGNGGARGVRWFGGNGFAGISIEDRIDALTSAYVLFNELPSEVHFGSEAQSYRMRPAPDGSGFLPLT